MKYLEEIKSFIINELIEDKSIQNIEMETPLGDLVDSLNMVKLIVYLEKQLKIDLLESDVDINDFRTLAGIMNLVNRSMERMATADN